MPLPAAPDRKEIERLFEELHHDVTLSHFTQLYTPGGKACDTCDDTLALLEELTSMSDRLHLEVHDFVSENAFARDLGIDRIPAVVISSVRVKGRPRYFGMPSGYEFANLLDTLLEASRNVVYAAAEKKRGAFIDKAIHIQVFVTPTCSYCAPVARLAHQIAIENAHVTADIVAINEFADLAQRYVIRGVPKTVINERVEFTGPVSEEEFMEHLKRAI